MKGALALVLCVALAVCATTWIRSLGSDVEQCHAQGITVTTVPTRGGNGPIDEIRIFTVTERSSSDQMVDAYRSVATFSNGCRILTVRSLQTSASTAFAWSEGSLLFPGRWVQI